MPWVDMAVEKAKKTNANVRYGDEIRTWLTANFPDLCDPTWGPHPAASVAVVRLHYLLGRGRLTRAEHGPVIRAAVKAWDDKWGDD